MFKNIITLKRNERKSFSYSITITSYVENRVLLYLLQYSKIHTWVSLSIFNVKYKGIKTLCVEFIKSICFISRKSMTPLKFDREHAHVGWYYRCYCYEGSSSSSHPRIGKHAPICISAHVVLSDIGT